MKKSTRNRLTRLGTLSATLLFLHACSIAPEVITPAEQQRIARADRISAQAMMAPINAPITVDEAIARALKYNLDRRTRLMEEAIALNQFDLSQYDMLPRLVASLGYRDRSEYATARAVDSVTGAPSLANPFISSDKTHTNAELGLTWSLLDFGLSYYTAKQNADRVLIASERRRKAMHLLIQDVRTAFWRTASSQKLRAEVSKTIAMAEESLADARKVEEERLRSPLESLRYQRQLLENIRLLEAIDHELSSARTELAHLMNAPLGSDFKVLEPSDSVSRRMLDLPIEQLEEMAVTQNADLREQLFNTRIANEETKKTLLRMFPNLSFNYSLKNDNDRYLVHNQWNEAGTQLSFNLLNILSFPAQQKLAQAGVALADQRRVATQMAVLSQVHLARLQYASSLQQFHRADAIANIDEKISQQIASREQAQTQSKLDRVTNSTSAILSLLRRYQALAQVHASASKLQATLGMEPKLGSVQDISLQELTKQIQLSLSEWNQANLNTTGLSINLSTSLQIAPTEMKAMK
ncbi:TolC family protein [Undibacterium sp.]|uniref:TolC family protein n=1 Tax=Undibacterium sp. TaxID=1914977 RepID=UPI003751A9AE